ncbi:hypothetical protein [Flavobacterium branchiicola]|uniref:PepSY-associated transmembrane protein n=1 Tax=Flavobacterium branchiicola TaxID=1114875 RepID=A0ABV9PMR5_9FLAO|nr:hypothetical protein [Flavobacterium branchiicola]MBS7256304.1 hypothetical protein [Flavobacterium branchiicola]
MFLAFSNGCFAGGISSWEDVTPYGNRLYHDGENDELVELTVNNLNIWFKEFYFYKRHIVAIEKGTFFIINEKTNKVEEFHNEQAFKKALKEKKLIPVLITRWHDENYGIDKFWVPFLMVLLPLPFLMPIIWLFCLISLLRKTNKKLFLKKMVTVGYPAIVVLVLIIYNFPQSF